MPFVINDQKTMKNMQELASLTGLTLDEVVSRAIRVQLEKVKPAIGKPSREKVEEILKNLQKSLKKYPVQDHRPHGEILYDEDGLPKSRSEI